MSITPNIRFVGDVGSTMDSARDMIPEAQGVPFGVLAESQSKGKGTGGRSWFSPKGNMYFTYCVPQNMVRPDLLPILPLLIGLALRKSIARLIDGAHVHLKWPNDIIYEGKKLAGSLVESEGDYLIIGVGANVDVAPPVVDQGRASARINDIAEKLNKPKTNPKDVAETLWKYFFEMILNEKLTRAEVIQQFEEAMDKSLEMHRRVDGGRDPEVLFAVRLNEWGHLVVRKQDNTEETLSADYLF